MALLSLRAYAKHRGVALQAVQKAIASGRIQTTKDAKGRVAIDPVAADESWEASTDPSKQREEPEPQASSQASSTYAISRANRELWQSKIAKLEYEKLNGTVIDAEEAKRTHFALARRVRDAILNVSNRIDGELAAETDPVKVHMILTRALNEALTELAGAGESSSP